MKNEFDQVDAVPRKRGGGTNQNTGSGSSRQDARNGHPNEPRSKRQSSQERRSRPGRSRPRRWDDDDFDPRRALPYSGNEPVTTGDGLKLPFDPLRFVAALKRNWSWLAVSACILALLGLVAGAFFIKHKINVHLIRRQAPNVFATGGPNDPMQPREYSDQTLYSFMKSGEVFKRVLGAAATNAATARLKLEPKDLGKAVEIQPAPNPDIVTISFTSLGDVPAMVELANIYAREVVRYTQEVQAMEMAEINEYLKQKLTSTDKKIQDASEAMRGLSTSGILDFQAEIDADLKKLAELETRIDSRRIEVQIIDAQLKSGDEEIKVQAPVSRLAQEEAKLQELLVLYKEGHPEILRQKAIIEQVRKSDAGGGAKPLLNPAVANNPLFMRNSELRARKEGYTREIEQLQAAITGLRDKLVKSADKDKGISYAMARNQLQSLNTTRQMLQQRQEQAQAFTENALGYFRVHVPASTTGVRFAMRWLKIGVMGLAAAFAGFFVAALGVMLVEAMDTKLKTPEDVERVTQLPVLATLGDLRKMNPSAQVNWAFRTLTHLKGKLSGDPNEALVCGIISSGHGEGRSTWVNLLVSAASQRGLRVLTVDTRPTSMGPTANTVKDEKKPEPEPAMASAQGEGDQHKPMEPNSTPQSEPLSKSVLSTPATVTDQLTDPNSQPVVHIPLPGWVWNLERRKAWKDALEHWRKIDNLVIFVELPPASQPESVLLSEHLPQLLWLVGSGMAEAKDSAEQLSTLRHARCNLVGAVLNQAPPPVFNTWITRWFTKATALLAASFVTLSASAQETPSQNDSHRRALAEAQRSVIQPRNGRTAPAAKPLQDAEEEDVRTRVQLESRSQEAEEPNQQEAIRPAQPEIETPAPALGAAPANENMTFSGGLRKQRAKWQERLTLGPGDVFDIHVYGNKDMSRTNIFVGPDGTINFAHVAGLKAEGLTIDELRARLDEELSRLSNIPQRTIVIPTAFTSKRYYMLGKVAGKGVYVMDRPVTVVEAVARARGLETGLYQRNSVEMADLSRSFLVRNGERLNVNFEKLFLDGDLSQNVLLEPNDYLYFESAAANDIYVLGEVMTPGPIGFVPNATVLTAIADRGGYTEKAYKRKVLIVRGSLHQPESFIVDTGAILDARETDFKLQARDIIYVSKRPWSKVEELLDEAAQSFIQGAVTTWSGGNVGPIIKSRILPKL